MKTLVSLGVMLPLSLAGSPAEAVPNSAGPLDAYVAKPDASYGWRVRREGKAGPADLVELTLTSQTWRGIVWKHQLFVIRPSTLSPAAQHHALLYITGGSWSDELEQPARSDELPEEVARFGRIAQRLKTIVAVLRQVPRQPIFDGKHEDQIIAFTFERFLKTRDAEWPLLLPMVKSAVRAMDAVQQLAARRWSIGVREFTVTGASKRGWTTWLTGAVDRRAAAVAPMVIDVLNMAVQMEHQEEVWGGISYKINDYTERGLVKQFRTEGGKALRAIVDPYSYRERLTQPKLIIIGTNDHYWPIDALNLYWDDLVGPKYILYVPNNRHGLTDLDRVVATLDALHQHAAVGAPLPQLAWHFAEGRFADAAGVARECLTLTVDSDPPAREVRAWVAASPTRDFRQARWRAVPTRAAGESRQYFLAVPRSGFAAVFGEAVYDGENGPYCLSTNVRVVAGRANENK